MRFRVGGGSGSVSVHPAAVRRPDCGARARVLDWRDGRDRGEQILGYKDPGEIVIDELLGMWLVLLPFSDPGWAKIGIAFVLFRIFDMWKPWPVHASESWLPGGYGIMIDDVMAGLQALLVMWLLQLVGFWGV